VAVVQYTFTHKQYTEYRERNIRNNKKKKKWEVRAVPRLCELYPGICLATEKKARKNLKGNARKTLRKSTEKPKEKARKNHEVALWHCFLPLLGFSPVTISPPTLHTRSFITADI
jgi:hypothetical protein